MIRVSAIFLGLAVLGAAPASAQSDKDLRIAKLAIDTGQDHFRAERYKEAVAEFRKALQLVEDPGLIWNIARSYEELGDVKNAVHYFDKFSKKFPKDKDAPAAAKRAGALRPHLPGSVIVQCGRVPGGRVVVDGAHKAGCGQRVTGLRPGAHVAELIAPGRENLSREFFLTAGERLTLGFDDLLDLSAAPTTPVAAAEGDSPGGASVMPTALFIAAGALVAGAGVFAWMSHSDGVELEDMRGQDVRLSEVRALEDSSAGSALIANVLFGAAVAAGATGVIFTF